MTDGGEGFGRRYRFEDWPIPLLPDVAAGVYAVWRDDDELVYVGMSGRSIETVGAKRRYGLTTRLASHTSGRLSGDQFCVYVANRDVVPSLTAKQLPLFASDELRLDTLTKEYIAEHFSYSFVVVATSQEAHDLEAQARAGRTFGVAPTLNPIRPS